MTYQEIVKAALALEDNELWQLVLRLRGEMSDRNDAVFAAYSWPKQTPIPIGMDELSAFWSRLKRQNREQAIAKGTLAPPDLDDHIRRFAEVQSLAIELLEDGAAKPSVQFADYALDTPVGKWLKELFGPSQDTDERITKLAALFANNEHEAAHQFLNQWLEEIKETPEASS